GGNPQYLTAVGNTLYFSATDGTHSVELWKSDGTSSGTVMVKDIRNGSSGSTPMFFTVVGNALYFRADDGTHGFELFTNLGVYTEVTYS
ncbi:MAG: hyalin, partial [Euryarchaeota archaeon]|nr:hyalin [Euryarchaeota archaeon]